MQYTTLENAENRLDDGIEFVALALELMTNPQAMYQAGSERIRTIMNRTIFTKLYADTDTSTSHELNEPFDALTAAYSLWQGYPKDNRHRARPTPPQRGDRATQRSSAAP